MSLGGDWPIAIIATQDVACGARLWNVSGQRRVSLVVKATFALTDDAPMRVVSPMPISIMEHHVGRSLEKMVVTPCDIDPYLPRGEVLFMGHAHAPNGSPQASVRVRLVVLGSRPLVDKSLMVWGERVVLEDGTFSQPVPFSRMPITYERAMRGEGAELNPAGTAIAPGVVVPNVMAEHDAATPAGFGPIGATWPERERLLRGLDPATLEARQPEFPDTFAWSFFHSAPTDQRCPFFEGNEWIILEGLHPERGHFRTQLPSARAQGRLYLDPQSPGFIEFPLVADRLVIDGARSLATLSWRGSVQIEEDQLGRAQILAGLELPDRTIPWPESPQQVSVPPVPEVPPIHASSEDSAVEIPLVAVRRIASEPPATQQIEHDGPETEAPNTLQEDTTTQRPLNEILVQQLAEQTALPEAFDRPTLTEPSLIPSTEGAANTLTTPPNLLRKLLQEGVPSQVSPETVKPTFEDPETFQPDSTSLADIIQRAEQYAKHSPDKTMQSPGGPPKRRPSGAYAGLKAMVSGIGAPPPLTPPPAPDPETEFNFGDEISIAAAVMEAPASDKVATPPAPVAEPAPTPVPEAALADAPQSEASLARDHIAGGGMRKVRPPRTTIRGLNDPLNAPLESAPGPQEITKSFSIDKDALATEFIRNPREIVEKRLAAGESLATLNLEGADLSGVDFSKKKLDGVDLRSANLRGCKFDMAELVGAQLQEADLTGASFVNAKLAQANLRGAVLNDCVLREAELTEASFEGAIATSAIFDEAKGDRTSFAGGRFDCARFLKVKLASSDFTEAIIDGATFEDADLTEARFYEARGEAVTFERAKLGSARFDGAVLRRGRLKSVHAPDSQWDQAELDQASFELAFLAGASFVRASCRETAFSGADVSEARFLQAILWSARFIQVDVSTTRFDGADLRGAIIPGLSSATS